MASSMRAKGPDFLRPLAILSGAVINSFASAPLARSTYSHHVAFQINAVAGALALRFVCVQVNGTI